MQATSVAFPSVGPSCYNTDLSGRTCLPVQWERDGHWDNQLLSDWIRGTPQKGLNAYHGECCKKPLAQEVIGPRQEHTTIVLLNIHVELPSK